MTMAAAKCESDCAATGRAADGRLRIPRTIGQEKMGTVYDAQRTRGQVQAMTWTSPTSYPSLDDAFVLVKDDVGMDLQTFERRYGQLLASTGMR
jgi:hypothetical protein